MEAPTRVLIVDDDTDTLRLYGFALQLMGCDVVTSDSALDALRKASAAPPHVVVTDLAMPGMDGIELCEALKAGKSTHDVPVLAVSGQAFSGVRERAQSAGCVEVLLKPCLPEDLFAAVTRIHEQAEAAHEQAHAATVTARELKAAAQRLRAENRHARKREF